MDLGVHDFDWLRWCLGPVERVSALATRPDQGQVAVVTLAHQSGAISTVELSWVDPRGFATSVEVSGPDGLLCHDSRSSAAFSIDLWPTPEAQRPVVQMPARTAGDDPYRHELADALSWFGGGSPPRGNAIDAVGAVTLAEAANLSASRREPVAVAELINDVAI
jgi:predicted dehydrogenase